jgi:bifunctional non-homologous end joining protein LigD
MLAECGFGPSCSQNRPFSPQARYLSEIEAFHYIARVPSVSSPLGFLKLEVPTLAPEPPTGDGWIHEIKYDGYRTLIIIDHGQIRAFTRNGNDWTRAYRRVVEACARLTCETALIDGEMAVQDEHGITDFLALRSAIYSAPHRIVFFAFDLLHLDGQDLRDCPLLERRERLRGLIKPNPRSPIQFSDHVESDGAQFFKAAAELGLEGIVSERAASHYRSGPIALKSAANSVMKIGGV